MALTSWVFAVFLITVFTVYWLAGKKYRDIILILAGFFFYGYAALEQMPVMVVLTIITFVFGLFIGQPKDRLTHKNIKALAVIGVIIVLGFLVYYKYWVLLIRTWNNLIQGTGLVLAIPKVVAPLAISFLVFQFIHYLVDKYNGKIEGNSFRIFLLYTWFFPSLLAGPIKRYEDFAPQVANNQFDFNRFSIGLARLFTGLAKKIILADTFALWGDKLLAPQMNSGLMLLVAVYCYSFKIYFDFSAYSDIAIGLAKIWGYEIPENFNWPYIATSISDFWRRWHMSLSTWIKDYLFIPLGGSRVSYPRHFLNMVITMGLCGLWHGANWTFLVWGIWHGVGQGFYGIYKRSGVLSNLKDNLAWKFAGWFVTFNFVSFGWIFFAAKSMEDALLIFKRIFALI